MQKTEEKRKCAAPGCITVLSQRNWEDGLCYVHQDQDSGEHGMKKDLKKTEKEIARLKFRMGIKPASKSPIKNPSIKDLIHLVADAYGTGPKKISEIHRGREDQWPRKLATYLAYVYLNESSSKIAAEFNISTLTLTSYVKTVEYYLQENPADMTEVVKNIAARFVLSN